MINAEDIAPAKDALDRVSTIVTRLDAGCCDPGRSPRLRRLAATVNATRIEIDQLARRPGQAPVALAKLEKVGEQVGWLQVGCCAPSRIPLYAEILEQLNAAQISINRARGAGH